MMDRTPRSLDGSFPAEGMTFRRIRFGVALLLAFGILAWLGRSSLHAQPGPGQPEEKKDVDKKAEKKASDLPVPPVEQPPPDAAPVQRSGMKQRLKRVGRQVLNPSSDPATQAPSMPGMGGPAAFQFKIDPKTPLKDLLPTAPKIRKTTAPVLSDDLTRVPEVQFQAADEAVNAEAMRRIAHQIAKINHLNGKKTDGFIEALRDERLDLHGLPFAMGDACRTKGERSKQFALAVATVRQALNPSGVGLSGVAVPSLPGGASTAAPQPASTGSPGPGGPIAPSQPIAQAAASPASPEAFWEQYPNLCAQQDRAQGRIGREPCETIILARIAALRQILAPMPEMHAGLVKYLATISHAEATRELARMAIFSAEEDVRKAAIDALKVRRERDYTEILVKGLRYPWPAVANRAAEAITRLERNDLLPVLIDVLDEPDPRAPVTQEIDHKRVPVVRELVRVNHHRSCLLCHAPGNTGKVSAEAVSAEVPVPGQPLTPPSGGYNTSQPDILVRVDVTYLRQDFSALQAVADANPWPEMQRFDFLVRSRSLTDEEATAYREKLTPREPGRFSPYHRAALVALRELTGRDTEPTPEAWRRLLKLTPQSKSKTP